MIHTIHESAITMTTLKTYHYGRYQVQDGGRTVSRTSRLSDAQRDADSLSRGAVFDLCATMIVYRSGEPSILSPIIRS